MSDTTILPEGRLIRIEFECCLPKAATKDQIAEWIKFHMGGGSMANDNPLADLDGPEWWQEPPLLTDTRQNGSVKDYAHTIQPDGSVHYYRRYIRDLAT